MSAVRAFIGLGGNLGDPIRQIRAALTDLDRLPETRLLRTSGFYRTPPWGNVDQADFINAVAEVETRLAARPLLEAMLQIETRAGRVRGEERWGPRMIDLDLLLYGATSIDEEGLRVPHPRMVERAFVIVPLAELQPTLQLPGHGIVSALLEKIDVSKCTRLALDH